MNIMRLDMTVSDQATFKRHGLYNRLGVHPGYRSCSVVESDLRTIISALKGDPTGSTLAAKCQKLLAASAKPERIKK